MGKRLTQALLDDVPVEQVRAFEKDFREALRLKHADVLTAVATTGKLSDEATAAFEQEAADLSARYTA